MSFVSVRDHNESCLSKLIVGRMGTRRRNLDCVVGLLKTLDQPFTRAISLRPPQPDVRVWYIDRSVELFEVTQIRPNKYAMADANAASGREERGIKSNPDSVSPSSIAVEAFRSMRLRIRRKSRRTYAVSLKQTLSLLLVGWLPSLGAVASTYVVAQFFTLERLNAELNECLRDSPFQRVYLHLPRYGDRVWGWTQQQQSWYVLRTSEDVAPEGRQLQEVLRELRSGGVSIDTLFRWPRR